MINLNRIGHLSKLELLFRCFCFIFRQHVWVEERGKKLKCTAPQYVDYVMTFCQKCVSNQQLFPTKYGNFFAINNIPSIYGTGIMTHRFLKD